MWIFQSFQFCFSYFMKNIIQSPGKFIKTHSEIILVWVYWLSAFLAFKSERNCATFQTTEENNRTMSSSEAQTLLKHWVEYTSILAGMLIPLGEAVINIASHQVPPFRHVTRVHPSSTIHAAPWYQHYKPARINVLFMRINENWVCIKRGFQGENYIKLAA